MKFGPILTSLALSGLMGVAACGSSTDSTAPLPSPQVNFDSVATADLAPTAGEEAATAAAFFSSASSSSAGATFSLSPALLATSTALTTRRAWLSSNCTFSAATARFTCPPVTLAGFTTTVTYGIADSAGVAQSAYDGTTTNYINFIVADTGTRSYTFNGNTIADSVLRLHNRTVSGLKGKPDTAHTWNGTGVSHVTSTRSGQITRIYVYNSNDTTAAVRIKQPRSINPYPLSGTISRTFSIIRTKEASDTTLKNTTARSMVTFNGTADVPMTLTSAKGITSSYSLNLDTHKVTKQ